jgi:hypothetical protein
MRDHAEFLVWLSKSVAAANSAWRRQHLAGDLLTRDGMASHLYYHCRDRGLISPFEATKRPTAAVAHAFARDREAVVEAARNYWRIKREEANRNRE